MAFLGKRDFLNERAAVQMRIHDRGEEVRDEGMMQGDTPAVNFGDVFAMEPRKMVCKRAVFAAVDHGGSHASELRIADKLFLVRALHVESGDFTADGPVTALS